jgi:drug/metabolite transporter (DMT)-like permease
MTDRLKGLLITTFGALFVVPDALFIRLIDADPLVIGFWRSLTVGTGILLGTLLLQGVQPFRDVLGTGKYAVIYILTIGASGILFVLAISLTSVANVVFIIASLPVFAAIYSRIFLGEPISKRMILTMIAVAVGLAVIAFGSSETEGASWKGNALALCVSAMFAAGLTVARRVRPVSMVPAIPIGYLGGALILLPFIDPLSVTQWGLIALHGAFMVISATLLALGPRYITSAEVGLLILLETVLAPILVWATLGEEPGTAALIGGMIVISALVLSNLVALRKA